MPALKKFVQDEVQAIKGATHKSSQGDGARQYTLTGLSTNMLYVKRRLKEVETLQGATALVKLVTQLKEQKAAPTPKGPPPSLPA